MGRFLYYFPGLSGLNDRMLAGHGLWDRFSGPGAGGGSALSYGVTVVPEGPAGRGCVVALGLATPEMPADPSLWVRAGDYWVVAERTPGPEDLVRELGLQGTDVSLGDGHAWRVPLVKRWDDSRLAYRTNLPKTLQLAGGGGGKAERGGVVVAVAPAYQHLETLAGHILEAFAGATPMPLATVFDWCVRLLAANYRLGAAEVGVLGLLDEEAARRVLAAAIDLPKMQAQAIALSMEGLEARDVVVQDDEEVSRG